MIEESRLGFPVCRLCAVLKVTPSSSYAWRNRPADITCLPTSAWWLYLSAILELHSRYVAGSGSRSLLGNSALSALTSAAAQRGYGGRMLHVRGEAPA